MQDDLLTRCARLVVARGPCAHAEFFFQYRLTIGRGDENSVSLGDASVSQRHAMIERVSDQYVLRDLGSRNGVLLNGKRITEAVLAADDHIQVGKALLVFLNYGGHRPSPDAVLLESAQEEASIAWLPLPAPVPGAATSADRGMEVATDLLASLDALDRDADAQVLAERILEIAVSIVPCDRGVLLTLHDGELRPAGVIRAKPESAPGPVLVPRSVLGRALGSREIVQAANTALDSRFNARDSVHDQGIVSLVAVPLLSGHELVGVLYLDSTGHTQTGAGTLPFLRLLGRSVGLFLGEVRRRATSIGRDAGRTKLRRLFSDATGDEHTTTATVLHAAVNTAGGGALEPAHYLALLDGFFRKAREAISRNGGEIESVTGPVLKAIFRGPDGPDRLQPVLAALQLHRECVAANLLARMTRGVELAVRIGLEVGELTVRALESLPGLTSVGEAATRSTELLNGCKRGELLVGPGGWAQWSMQLVRGRTVALGRGRGQDARARPGAAVTSLSSEPRPVGVAPLSAAHVVPVRAMRLDTNLAADALLLVESEADGASLCLQTGTAAEVAPWPDGCLVRVDIAHDSTERHTTLLARIRSLVPDARSAEAPSIDLDDVPTRPPSGFRARPVTGAGAAITYALELAEPSVQDAPALAAVPATGRRTTEH